MRSVCSLVGQLVRVAVRASLSGRRPAVGRRRRIPVRHGSCRGRRSSSGEELLLATHAFLLGLEGGGAGFDESILDWPYDIRGEHGPSVDRSGNGFFPRLQHLVHLPAGHAVDRGIGIHEGLVKPAAKEERIRSSDVLDYRVENVQSGEFPLGSNL